MSRSTRTIPSLDGLRALSILMVVSSHVPGFAGVPPHIPLSRVSAVVAQPDLGVAVFFVISGFLITHLLLRELDSAGTIHIRRFYFRRLLRIFPPYYVFLAAVLVLGLRGIYYPGTPSFLSALTYTSNYYPYWLSHPESTGWFVGHTWSLSLEEQFYLIWPGLLLLVKRRYAVPVSVTLLALAVAGRLLTWKFAPQFLFDGQIVRMFHTRIDTLIFGCLLALLYTDEKFIAFTERLFRPLLLGAAAFYLACAGIAAHRLPPWYDLLFGKTLTGLCIAFLLLYLVRHPETPLGHFLNYPPVKHLGVISYSLYLWQQLFLGPIHLLDFPLTLLAAFCCAEASYWLIEKPSFTLRDRLEKKIFRSALSAEPLSERIVTL